MKVSIITAVFNGKLTLADAIDSALSQSYENIEYIIIDGGSVDGTLNLIHSYGNRISVLISEPDFGIYDGMNKGIRSATGDIICFLHADDFFANKTVIADVVATFEKCGVDSVYGNLDYVGKDDVSKVIRQWISGPFSYSKLRIGWMPPHPAFFVKRAVYDKFGCFDTNFMIAADYDFILRVLGKFKISIAYLPKTLYKMRVGGISNRSIKTIIRKSSEDLRALRKNCVGGFMTIFIKNISKIPQFLRCI